MASKTIQANNSNAKNNGGKRANGTELHQARESNRKSFMGEMLLFNEKNSNDISAERFCAPAGT